ncbi:MAG: TetR/AcrR family transcriptional regulator [Halanaerobiales bacterium]
MLNIDKNDIKKKRIMKIFINSTTEVIEKEGIENVTIRKVADIAGYNSATLYNYFDNCKQLVFFAATNFISEYVEEMPEYIEKGENTLQKLLLMWECFCLHTFRKPKIYYAIFQEDVGEKPENLVELYYKIFPEELKDAPEELVPMLLESRLSRRAEIAMQPCIEEGYFAAEDEEEIDEAIRLIYHGMLSLVINNRVDFTPEEATKRCMKHIKSVVDQYKL